MEDFFVQECCVHGTDLENHGPTSILCDDPLPIESNIYTYIYIYIHYIHLFNNRILKTSNPCPYMYVLVLNLFLAQPIVRKIFFVSGQVSRNVLNVSVYGFTKLCVVPGAVPCKKFVEEYNNQEIRKHGPKGKQGKVVWCWKSFYKNFAQCLI